MAGCVSDAELMLSVLAGDAWPPPRPPSRPPAAAGDAAALGISAGGGAEVGSSAVGGAAAGGVSPIRIAVSLRSPSPIARLSPHFAAAVREVADGLADAGHVVEDRDPPYGPLLIARWMRRWQVGVYDEAHALGLAPAALEPRTRTIVAKGRRIRRVGGPRPGVVLRWQWRMARWFAEVDVLITPTVATPPRRAGSATGKRYPPTLLRAAASVPYTPAWNLAGYPAASLPAGIGPDGLPTAVQIVAAPGREDLLLRAAYTVEAMLRPPAEAEAVR
jgi:amidase